MNNYRLEKNLKISFKCLLLISQSSFAIIITYNAILINSIHIFHNMVV